MKQNCQESPQDKEILKVFQYEIGHFGIQLQLGIPTMYAMVLVGIDPRVKLLIRLNQRIDHFHGILKMNIVIGRGMNDQELPF